MDSATTYPRGTLYPKRHLGRALLSAIQSAIDAGRFNSASAVGRWLGVERSKLHGWTNGRSLPQSEADRDKLTRLGFDLETIETLCLRDRLDAFSRDAGLDPGDLIQLAADVERASGVTIDELVRLLERKDWKSDE